MGQRTEKLMVGAAVVVASYWIAAIIFSFDDAICRAAEQAFPMPVHGELLLAIVPALMVAIYLTVDSAIPIGTSAINRLHGGMYRAYAHLFVDGQATNYWHLRLVIAVLAIITVQIVADAVEYIRVG